MIYPVISFGEHLDAVLKMLAVTVLRPAKHKPKPASSRRPIVRAGRGAIHHFRQEVIWIAAQTGRKRRNFFGIGSIPLGQEGPMREVRLSVFRVDGKRPLHSSLPLLYAMTIEQRLRKPHPDIGVFRG